MLSLQLEKAHIDKIQSFLDKCICADPLGKQRQQLNMIFPTQLVMLLDEIADLNGTPRPKLISAMVTTMVLDLCHAGIENAPRHRIESLSGMVGELKRGPKENRRFKRTEINRHFTPKPLSEVMPMNIETSLVVPPRCTIVMNIDNDRNQLEFISCYSLEGENLKDMFEKMNKDKIDISELTNEEALDLHVEFSQEAGYDY